MVYGSVYESVANTSALANVEPFEFEESMSFMDMGAQTLEESTNDWNNMMRAIGITELSYVAETGQELIYEAVDVKAIKDRIIKWFLDLWAKIQGIANAALAKFASYSKNDDKFIAKYEQYLKPGLDAIPEGFSFKGYKFDDEAISTAVDKIQSESDNMISIGKIEGLAARGTSGGSSNPDADINAYRASIIPGYTGNEVTKSDFAKALNKALRGSDAKVSLSKADIDITSIVDNVKGAKAAVDGAKNAKKTIKSSIDKCIELVNKMAKDYEAADEKNAATMMTNHSALLKKVEDANTVWFSNYIRVLNDRNRQSKALCVKLVQYGTPAVKNAKKNGSGSTNEAASILEDRFAAIFGD